jgi:hypothetical protein
MTIHIRQALKIALSGLQRAANRLPHPWTPRGYRKALTRSDSGSTTLATLVVGACLAAVAVALIQTHVVEPIRQTADTAVTSFDQRLDCYATGDTYCP